MGRPQAIRDGDPIGAGQQARGGLVGIGPVSPGHQLEMLPHRRGRRERPLELGDEDHGVAAGAKHEERRTWERHRVVAGEVGEVARRRHDEGVQLSARGLLRRSRESIEVDRLHSLKSIGRGTIWKVAGVAPNMTPSARTGIGRSDRTSKRIFAFSSRMRGSGT